MLRPRASREARDDGYKRLKTVRERAQDRGPKGVLTSGRAVKNRAQ